MFYSQIRNCLFILFLVLSTRIKAQNNFTRTILFDNDWHFYRGGVERGGEPGINDSAWRVINLPHDWSIEDLPGTNSPFNPDAISQVSGGFTTGGTGWYRKTFTVSSDQKNKRFQILFEGIYMNADVWVNGHYLGNHPYGYTSFWYDLTDYIKFNDKNVLAVQVKNEGQNSRWYSGSGINRHVWLNVLDPVHAAQWGAYITTPEITAHSSKINISTKLDNETGKNVAVSISTKISDSKGIERGRSRSEVVLPPQGTDLNQVIIIGKPDLWSVDSPFLYKAVTEVYMDQHLLDRIETKFGIRAMSVNAEKGFLLNGKLLKLKGGCYHNDNGPLGSKAYDRAEERRVELMKASGFNAIRCSHNPPAPAFLEACDRLGILVIDEAFDMWKEGKTPYDYHLYFNEWWQKDIESMVSRDRNHPSVIMWSIGNEIPGRERTDVAAMAKRLVEAIRKLDTTRFITSAVNDVKEDKDPYFAVLDVAGYNYAFEKYKPDHVRKPERIMMATESYPLEAYDYWMEVLDHPYVIGDFVWTGFDYIGEASIGWRGYMQEKTFYPWNLAYCGDIDICGWKRPQSFYRDALWKEGQLSLFVKPPKPSFGLNPNIESWSKWNWQDVVEDWNWEGYENNLFEINVYSSCDEVELFLNGQSLGKKITNRSTRFLATWQVPYRQGTLKAIGYKGKNKIATTELHSANKAVKIKLTPDRSQLKANGEDLSYITVELIDSNGIRDPRADKLVHFELDGPGSIVGVGNADPLSLESYQQPQRNAWRGKCLVVIKTNEQAGEIRLKASADGVKPAELMMYSAF